MDEQSPGRTLSARAVRSQVEPTILSALPTSKYRAAPKRIETPATQESIMPAARGGGGTRPRRHRPRPRSVAPGTQLERLASTARDLRPYPDPDPRRGRRLRRRPLQRPPAPRTQGHDERSRAARPPRTPPGRGPEQGAAGRAALGIASRAGLRTGGRGGARGCVQEVL